MPKHWFIDETKERHLKLKPSQYDAIVKAATERGLPRHGGPSILIREVLGQAIGLQP